MLRILIAEDNELVAMTLEEQLKDLGYDVPCIARTGRDAVLLATQLHPNLILMDFRMPEMNGADAAQRIQQHYAVPIIMMTAYTDQETVRKAEQAGVLSYLVKPVDGHELPPAINIAIARFREMQALTNRVTDLEQTLETRKIIERAKGILMQRLRISERDAYERLRHRAREKRVRMKDIAQAIIEAEELFGM